MRFQPRFGKMLPLYVRGVSGSYAWRHSSGESHGSERLNSVAARLGTYAFRIAGPCLTCGSSRGENRAVSAASVLKVPMKPGIALLLALFIACPATPVSCRRSDSITRGYRKGGRQWSIYLGRSEELARRVRDLLARLQHPRRWRRDSRRLQAQVRASLRKAKAQLREKLARWGIILKGWEFRGIRRAFAHPPIHFRPLAVSLSWIPPDAVR